MPDAMKTSWTNRAAVSNSRTRRPRRHPQRMCIACRRVQAKYTLVRLVRTPKGVLVDPKGKMNGRGAYIHASRSCGTRAMGLDRGRAGKGRLPVETALKTSLTSTDRTRLEEWVRSLPVNAAIPIPSGERQGTSSDGIIARDHCQTVDAGGSQ